MSADVVARIDRLAKVDLVRLLDAVEAAEQALLEFEDGRRKVKSTPAPAPKRTYGTQAAPPPKKTKVQRVVTPRRVRELWDEIRGPICSHVERERTLVLPGCRHVVSGNEALRGGLKAPLRQMVMEHRQISEGVTALRLEAARTEPVRNEFLAVCRLWDEHVDDEESVVFPEALAEVTDEVTAFTSRLEMSRDADDISSNLRDIGRQRTAEPAPPREESVAPRPEGMFSRLFRVWERKK